MALGKKRPLSDLLEIMKKLRDPKEGCQWDLEQTSKSLIPYIIEESYELAEALGKGDSEQISDELGDLLLQIVFQAQIAKEKGLFDMDRIIDKAAEKMIRRHPHIFGVQKEKKTIEEQKISWEKIKKQERLDKGEEPSPFMGTDTSLPPLNRARKLQNTASSLGLDFNDLSSIITTTLENLLEFEKTIKRGHEKKIKHGIGELLFSMINLARKLDLDPELCIREVNTIFSRRCIEYFRIRDDFEKKNGTTKEFSPSFAWESIKVKEDG